MEGNMRTNSKISNENILHNTESYEEQLNAMDEEKLSKHLDLIHQQMEMAYEQEDLTTFKSLQEYEQQVMMSSVLKSTPNIH